MFLPGAPPGVVLRSVFLSLTRTRVGFQPIEVLGTWGTINRRNCKSSVFNSKVDLLGWS